MLPLYGNIIASLIPGLPFCHGAGGVTAHAKGGASTERMNWIIGGALLLVSILIYFFDLTIRMDSFALPAILGCVGVFHLELARPLWKEPLGRVLLALSVLVTLLRSDLLLVLIAAFLVHALGKKFWKGASHG